MVRYHHHIRHDPRIYASTSPVQNFWSLADTLIPSLVLGQAIGRWGNFVNQEAYGNLITNPDLQFFPYSVYIEELGQWHQATFFYESALNTLLLIVMLISYPHFRKRDICFRFT